MKIKDLEPKLPHPASVKLATVGKDGVFPQRAYLTGNLVEFFYIDGRWQLPIQPRMDGVVLSQDEERLKVVESNKLKKGQRVIEGTTEDGSEGIYVTNLASVEGNGGGFGFMQSAVSRERRSDYAALARVVKEAREAHGKLIWVLGPAVVHSGGIDAMIWLIRQGYVGALFGGNAIGVHDIEHAMKGTSLGLKDDSTPAHNGHRNHLEAVNAIRGHGSIEKAVEAGTITHGIMYECVINAIPFVLAGSIRDDGPLPDTITDSYASQLAMRQHTIDATAVVMIATVLHSVATGNMTPTYRVAGDEVLPIPVISVDTEEFPTTKLIDRGTGQAFPVIANAADFLDRLVGELSK